MKTPRFGFVAVAVLVALSLPAVAHANEVTKWNDIAVSTINASTQPAIVSAPPAGAVFMAMVQGAVYGAANAVDRHGKPYLINRSFPKASEKAAIATAAYQVLNALFPSSALDSAYAASIATGGRRRHRPGHRCRHDGGGRDARARVTTVVPGSSGARSCRPHRACGSRCRA